MDPRESPSRTSGWRPAFSQETPALVPTPAPSESTLRVALDPRSAVDRFKHEVLNQLVATIDSGRLRTLTLDRQRLELRTLLLKRFASDPTTRAGGGA